MGRPIHEVVQGAVVLAVLSAAIGCYSGVSLDGNVDTEGVSGDAARVPGGWDDGDDRDDSGGDAESQCPGDAPSVGLVPARLLTRYEYDNTLWHLLGDDSHPAANFPPENRSTAFENNAWDHRVSKELVRGYFEASEAVAQRAVDLRIDALLPCDPAVDGESVCGHAFVRQWLDRAFRRPARPEELALFEELFDDISAEQGFTQGIAAVIEAALQSPPFLYRLEETPEGAAAGDVVEVTGYAMASRLSYFLTASMPDDALFAAAADGRLSTPDEVEEQARRLLETDAGRRAVAQFHRQWLGLGALDAIAKDSAMYPEIALSEAGPRWQRSIEALVEHVFFEEGTVDALLGSDQAFLPSELAAYYGFGAPDPVTGAYTVTGEAAGLLSQPGLLAMLALPDQSSPVARGVFVRERLLCQHLPPPPDGVQIPAVELDPDGTTRETIEQLTQAPACAGCHALINPVGFAFEHYDGVGRWRDEQNGRSIDSSGNLSAVDDDTVQGDFVGVAELADKIAASADFRSCVVEQWGSFALGRHPAAEDHCSLEYAQSVLEDSGGDLREMLVAIAVSPAFRHRIVEAGQ